MEINEFVEASEDFTPLTELAVYNEETGELFAVDVIIPNDDEIYDEAEQCIILKLGKQIND